MVKKKSNATTTTSTNGADAKLEHDSLIATATVPKPATGNGKSSKPTPTDPATALETAPAHSPIPMTAVVDSGAAVEPVPANPAESSKAPTITSFLIDRMYEQGIRTVFGLPGDYVLGFYEALFNSGKIELINATSEDCAGYAADAYARVSGMGALCITYCVGGLSVVNAVAQAYAEKSPLLVISGSPGISERSRNALLHHTARDFDTQWEIFQKVTVASAVLDDPAIADREIERVFEAIQRYKRPGYLEIPRDMAFRPITLSHRANHRQETSDPDQLREALEECKQLLSKAERPVMLVGVEVHRFGLQEEILKIAEQNNLLMCSTLLGKSVVRENHPLYVGVYGGAMGRETPRQIIEEADCVLMLGTFLSDINLGIGTANLDPARCIYATSENFRIRHHHYHDIIFQEFVRELSQLTLNANKRENPRIQKQEPGPFQPQANVPVTISRLFEKVNSILTDQMVVICDVGDALFAGADLFVKQHTEFLSPAYYTSMGFAIPAALGAQCATSQYRPIVLVGDGAFQMTCSELSTILRRKLNPIILVLNNKGYSTERFIRDGAFNDIGVWNYHKMTELLGGGWGFEVKTETDLENALEASLANRDSFSLINIHLDPYDRSEAMERLATRLSTKL